MLYLNPVKQGLEISILYLTLTSVVFEFIDTAPALGITTNLTLTSVVFECNFFFLFFYFIYNLTLTSVVFESVFLLVLNP